MPTLPTQSFQTIVTNIAAGIQGRAAKLINFSKGSALRAIAEGFAGLFLWFQAMVLQLLTAIRLSTASGIDVDTFTADFMPVVPGTTSPRLGSQAASGQVTFSRFTAGPTTCFIPAASGVTTDGTITNAGSSPAATVKTTDGSQSFVVTADATYSSYSASLGGYTMPADIGTLNVPVKAILAGSGGNVTAGAIGVITSSLTGIDTVSNVAAFTNGADQESDNALKKRFSAYIMGLSRGDKYGLTASIEGTAVTVQWSLTESYNLDGSWHPGYFFVVADDGSGAPSPDFLQTITDAAYAVRPLGIQCAVFAPRVINAAVSMTIATADGYDHNTVCAQVSATVAAKINALGLGNSLPWSVLASWAYSVAGVSSVSSVILNNATGDGATINAYRTTFDNLAKIFDATIKCASCSVS